MYDELQHRRQVIGGKIVIHGTREVVGVSLSTDEIAGSAQYSGIERNLGGGTVRFAGIFNSDFSTQQLVTSLAFVSHPVLDEMVNGSDYSLHDLVEHRVLSGTRILDLGCGMYPVFPRVARKLGAEVWTVDAIAKDAFVWEDDDCEARALERRYHIGFDLNIRGTNEILAEVTGGEFDIVTHAQLMVSPEMAGERLVRMVYPPADPRSIAMPLLKAGGLYLPL